MFSVVLANLIGIIILAIIISMRGIELRKN